MWCPLLHPCTEATEAVDRWKANRLVRSAVVVVLLGPPFFMKAAWAVHMCTAAGQAGSGG